MEASFRLVSILFRTILLHIDTSGWVKYNSILRERKCQKEFINLKSSTGYACMVFGPAVAPEVENWY